MGIDDTHYNARVVHLSAHYVHRLLRERPVLGKRAPSGAITLNLVLCIGHVVYEVVGLVVLSLCHFIFVVDVQDAKIGVRHLDEGNVRRKDRLRIAVHVEPAGEATDVVFRNELLRMRVRTAQRIRFHAHYTQEENLVLVSLVHIFLLLGCERRPNKNDIHILSVLIDNRLEQPIFDQASIRVMQARRAYGTGVCGSIPIAVTVAPRFAVPTWALSTVLCSVATAGHAGDICGRPKPLRL
mmetsp:Transcript_3801/g.8474  ORF Transcript_3801/g.8474 Transcript_3801/m.8474 type:complete len:240 (-) Transcript_3801:1123-1842(-)